MRLTLLSCTFALIAAPAFAADLGTYRPGVPYHSVIVPTANVCESQCEGDAQCRGWNYVKAAPKAPGVCEFQSSISNPISSAISISGISNSAMPMSSRVIEGNTNTVRVGTAVSPKPTTIAQTQSARRIVRQAVPGQYPSAYGTPQPGLRPALDSYSGPQPQMSQPTLSRGPARQSPQMRNMRPVAPQNTYQSAYGQPQNAKPYQAPTYQAQPYRAPNYQGRPPLGQAIPQAPTQHQNQAQFQGQAARTMQAPQIIPANTQPQTYRQPQAYTQPYRQAPAQPMPRSSANNPVSWESIRQPQYVPQTQQAQPRLQPQPSLYGQLNDDTRQSAPMPTTGSYPSQPVTQIPLAGAQPR